MATEWFQSTNPSDRLITVSKTQQTTRYALGHDLPPHRIEPEPARQGRRIAEPFQDTPPGRRRVGPTQQLPPIGTRKVIRQFIKNVIAQASRLVIARGGKIGG